MSETASSAPAAVVPDTGDGDRHGPVSPPATSQPSISVTEAARLLRQQRGNGQAPAEGAPSQQVGAQQDVRQGQQPPAQPQQPARQRAELSAMERSLGLGPQIQAAQQAAAPAPEAAIAIDGQNFTQAQLREAVLKARDYTQKTQELGRQFQSLQQQQQSLAQVLPYIQPELQKLGELVSREVPRPDPSLISQDPATYWQQREAWERHQEDVARLGQIEALQQQAQQRMFQQQVQHGFNQLVQEFPWWSDQGERQKAQSQIRDWARGVGFTDAEMDRVTDPRIIKAMMMATTYAKWASGARTAPRPQIAAATGPVRGAPPPPAPSERVEQAYSTFDQRPNLNNAVALVNARRAANNGGMPRG